MSNSDISSRKLSESAFGKGIEPGQLASEIEKFAAGQARVLIAIAGAPGSGKSTFAEHLSGYLGKKASVIPMDGFHLDNSVLEAKGLLSVKGAPRPLIVPVLPGLSLVSKRGKYKNFLPLTGRWTRSYQKADSYPKRHLSCYLKAIICYAICQAGQGWQICGMPASGWMYR